MCGKPRYGAVATQGTWPPYHRHAKHVLKDVYFASLSQMKAGRAPAGQKEIVTAANIHPALSHLHRIGYYRRKLLSDAGVIPAKSAPGSCDSFILDMIHWAECVFFCLTFDTYVINITS